MKTAIIEALDAASDGYSSDRVVADPELNRRFISECRLRGLEDSAEDLNRALLNLRKAGGLTGRPRAKRTHFHNEDEYRFASEIAARFLERRDGISLDSIICNPDKVSEFDEVAARIVPGYSPLQYRWAALGLRKKKKLAPETTGRIVPPEDVISIPINEIVPDELPASQGIYLFISSDQLLYVGETENLRKRLKKHLGHSDNKGLARWIWEYGTESMHLELQILKSGTKTSVRKAIELELIRSRQPIFNVKR
jgi:site-specific DNA-methyltransferase (adenine-specific)